MKLPVFPHSLVQRPGRALPNPVVHGALAALAAFFIFPWGDALTTTIVRVWPGTLVAFSRYALGALVIGMIIVLRDGPGGLRMPQAKLQWIRALAIAIGTASFFSSLGIMPLADATAIAYTSPLWTLLLSALLLRERIAPAHLVYVLAGFCGVLLILRPNMTAFGAAALLPLLTAIGNGTLMMVNRHMAGTTTSLANQFCLASKAALLLLPAVLLLSYGPFSARPTWLLPAATTLAIALVTFTGTAGHLLLFRATTEASASAIAPIGYSQIVFSIGVGWLLLGHAPDAPVLAGSAIIVASGLLLVRSHARVARALSEAGAVAD